MVWNELMCALVMFWTVSVFGILALVSAVYNYLRYREAARRVEILENRIERMERYW